MPRYKNPKQNEVYAYRPSEDMYYSSLPAHDVVAKDTRIADAVRGGQRRFFKNVGEYLGQSQQQLMGLVTGTRQRPSEVWGGKPVEKSRVSWKDRRSPLQRMESTEQNAARAAVVGSNLIMDAIVDPINILPGIGLYSLSGRAGKSALVKSLNPYKHNIHKPAFKAQYLKPDFSFRPRRQQPIDKELKEIATQEVDKQLLRQNRTRARNWDERYGTKLTRSLDDLERMRHYPDVKQQYPMNLRIADDIDMMSWGENVLGQSKMIPETRIKAEIATFRGLDYPYKFKDFETVVRPNYKGQSMKEKRQIIGHELRHNIELNQANYPKEAAKRFEDVVVENKQFLNRMQKKGLGSNPKIDELTELAQMHNYYSNPIEASAYGTSNVRREMLENGIIKSIDEQITPEKINQLLSNADKVELESVRFFLENVLDKTKLREYADLMNEYLLGVGAGAAIMFKKPK